jgi:hypothetical protein
MAMDPRTERRLLLIVACAMALTIIAVLSLAHPTVTGPVGEDTAEGVAPPGEAAGEPPVDHSRDDGLGEPDEVHEDVEGPPAPDDKD